MLFERLKSLGLSMLFERVTVFERFGTAGGPKLLECLTQLGMLNELDCDAA